MTRKTTRKTLTALFILASARQGINRFHPSTQKSLIAHGWAEPHGKRSVRITDAGVQVAVSLASAVTWNTIQVKCDPRSDSTLKLIGCEDRAQDERGIY